MLKTDPRDIENLLSTLQISWNLSVPQLIEASLERKEGQLTSTGAIVATTGKFTGRSPKDKFIVDEPSVRDSIGWGGFNQPISEENFERIYERLREYMKDKHWFGLDCYAGTDPDYRITVRVITEYAWHSLFAKQLFIRPNEPVVHKEPFTVIDAPGFKADPATDGTNSDTFIIVNFSKRLVLIGGTEYAGEIKKSVFTFMNYLLPEQDVLPMHCSANIDSEGRSALFFGLSGTGKTTLSTDPERRLVGDDEHGWSANGIFNIEGGCYAKCINLSKEKEPQIYNAIRFGTVLENVIIDDDTRIPDYTDDSLTENTRAAYPVEFIEDAVIPGIGGHPDVILFLTADAFGVLPPIAHLSKEQAMYYFLSGYTSKLAGTERGVTDPEATFSTCFGAPFLPRPAHIYANMLGDLIERHGTRVYLINTGWTGGPYGTGERMNLEYTRTMVRAAINNTLDSFETEPYFGLSIPKHCPGVPAHLLNPRSTWKNPEQYDEFARQLVEKFNENFQKFENIDPSIRNAGPKPQL